MEKGKIDLDYLSRTGTTVTNCLDFQEYLKENPPSAPKPEIPIAPTSFNPLSPPPTQTPEPPIDKEAIMVNNLRNGCSSIKWDFGILYFFDPEHDFRSSLVLNFSVWINQNSYAVGSDDYKKSELETKKKLLAHIHFTPDVTLTPDDIAFYGGKLVLNPVLKPETNYQLSLDMEVLRSDGYSALSGGSVSNPISSWNFHTPENKTLLIRAKDRATLYATGHPPVLQVLSYNTQKTDTKIKVCRLDLENYAKVEVILKNRDLERSSSGLMSGEATMSEQKLSAQEQFFYDGIDSIKNSGCTEVPVQISDEKNSSTLLIKKEIPLASIIEKLGKTGLYVVIFSDKNDRYYNGRMQAPLLLGSINAHTTMKVSKNGQAFFFVNDFAGKPLENIEMSVNVNTFSSRDTNYDNGTATVTEHSPFDKSVYSKSIVLWKTDKNGILQTNLKGKIDDYFTKTFDNSYDFDQVGKYDSFFVTGQNADTLTYISSQWNSGIAPWNFGYTTGNWYDSSSTNDTTPSWDSADLTVNQEMPEDVPYVAHIFADRVLYLPGETVSIKSIIRRSLDLSSPKGEKFTVQITDDQAKEIKRTVVSANEFGSVLSAFALPPDAKLGAYTIILLTPDDREITRTNFTVQVFKNPKFTTDIHLTTVWLNGETVAIEWNKVDKNSGYWWNDYNTEYTWKFTIKADLIGRYYSGGVLSGSSFTYKVYREEYYDENYWGDCYYGCFWEPNKEFYTEWSGTFDGNGAASLTIPVEFTSAYSDYRYIVEVTPRDAAGDVVSSTNTTIARLPAEYKNWDPNTSLTLETEKRFYPTGSHVMIKWTLSHGAWDDSQEHKYLLIVKKKTFDVQEVPDVRGYNRTITTPKEEIVEIIPVWKDRFTVAKDGTISMDYVLPDTAEYIFEFGSINGKQLSFTNITIPDLISEFTTTKKIELEKDVNMLVDNTTDFWSLSRRCVGGTEKCDSMTLMKQAGCDLISSEVCTKVHALPIREKISIDDLILWGQFFSLLTYSDEPAKNPVVSDNKIQVLSEKVSYKIGEKARVLIRLPFSHGKILWTVEKRWVMQSEYLDVPGNVFFREVTVDDSFTPNAYIGVVAIDTDTTKVPEYKVGYTEIVVDKTDKKADVTVSADKKTYAPRDKVTLAIQVKDPINTGIKSELTVMVVDDSLVSMMGNIDMNTLEKIWQKLPFQIQTSITNIAMLKNYYFARPGIVGGSWADNEKGGDSAKSTRNIFKNTAYYNGHVVTDANGVAHVTFTLPDNLTQFRVMVLSNSTDNTFGAGQTLFSVQKPVTIEDKTPLILHDGDRVTLGANVFNQTGRDMTFAVDLKADGLKVTQQHTQITLKNGANTFVSFDAQTRGDGKNIPYTMTVTGDSFKNSDGIQWTIKIAESPTLIQRVIKDDILINATRDYSMQIPENTLIPKSTYEVSISNNPLQHLESIISSLLIYPYGCIEQSTSTTVPNVLARKFAKFLTSTSIDLKKADEQTKVWLARIASMQVESGGFAYWQGESIANLHITPYVLRSLIDMRDMGAPVDQTVIDRATKYLTDSMMPTADMSEKTEIFAALARNGQGQIAHDLYFPNAQSTKNLARHERIAYTYGLLYTDKKTYHSEILANIDLIKNDLVTSRTDDYYWYWDRTSDMATFVSILMKMDYDQTYITTLVKQLGDIDYENYYLSTESKNAAFWAFIDYMEKYGNDKNVTVSLTMGDTKKDVTITGNAGRFLEKNTLADVAQDGSIKLMIVNDTKVPVFVNVRLSAYPADVLKVKKYEHNMTLTRTIQEVVDTKVLAQCSDYYYSDQKNCDKAFQTVDWQTFKKWATYKVTLTATFTDGQDMMYHRSNMTLEDYLPGTFRVLNSQFRTNSIATNQNTTENYWYFNHVEVQPNVVMAYAENIWWNKIEYSYFVTPEFAWTFLYPPATAYLMYNLDTRAYGTFNTITVK